MTLSVKAMSRWASLDTASGLGFVDVADMLSGTNRSQIECRFWYSVAAFQEMMGKPGGRLSMENREGSLGTGTRRRAQEPQLQVLLLCRVQEMG
jgi:hypothetical protein